MMTEKCHWTIPPDYIDNNPHTDLLTAAAAPTPWSIPKDIFQPIWDRGITGRGVVVAVNDTGVVSHKDLPEPIAAKGFSGGVPDGNGHGTHCSGTVLGRNGIGVAPEADLIIAKVLSNSGSGSTRAINMGREWAAESGADVISESLGGPSGSPQDIASIQKAYKSGCSLVVAAAGNSGYRGGNTIGYPGRYDETYCIGATRADGAIATFSSGGREIDCATPGQDIISCSNRGGYRSMSGTSMATPWMAGLMALVIQKARMQGFAEVIGADEWREFFSARGMFEDRGKAGKDERFGIGFPIIDNILKWLSDENDWI